MVRLLANGSPRSEKKAPGVSCPLPIPQPGVMGIGVEGYDEDPDVDWARKAVSAVMYSSCRNLRIRLVMLVMTSSARPRQPNKCIARIQLHAPLGPASCSTRPTSSTCSIRDSKLVYLAPATTSLRALTISIATSCDPMSCLLVQSGHVVSRNAVEKNTSHRGVLESRQPRRPAS